MKYGAIFIYLLMCLLTIYGIPCDWLKNFTKNTCSAMRFNFAPDQLLERTCSNTESSEGILRPPNKFSNNNIYVKPENVITSQEL